MLCFFPDLLPFTYLLDRVELWNQVPALGAHLGRFFLRSASLASSVNENWSAKALWKVPELWKNQKTVCPQLLGPSVHTSHNAGCCGPSSNTTFLLLPRQGRSRGRRASAGTALAAPGQTPAADAG